MWTKCGCTRSHVHSVANLFDSTILDTMNGTSDSCLLEAGGGQEAFKGCSEDFLTTYKVFSLGIGMYFTFLFAKNCINFVLHFVGNGYSVKAFKTKQMISALNSIMCLLAILEMADYQSVHYIDSCLSDMTNSLGTAFAYITR
jgi:hypothetical protein